MNKTISSLAILKVNWDSLKRDYVESFIPFLATLIGKRKYKDIDVNKICKDFTDEYGLIIPYHPMITILNRAKTRGFVKQRFHKYIPIEKNISKYEFSSQTKDQLRKQEKVIKEFIDYSLKHYSVELSQEVAESIVLAFLKENDLDILFATQHLTVLPSVNASQKHKYLINSFIKYSIVKEPEIFNFIVSIVVGHILASALLYDKLDNYKGKLKNVNFYFDTTFIFRLLGLEEEKRKIAYGEFIETLIYEKANLFIFLHTFEEVKRILENCLKWIGHTNYDPSFASQALKYFVQNSWRESDVERFLVGLENLLKKYQIRIVDTPDPDKDKSYQIDEEKIQKVIVETYSELNPYFDQADKAFTIQRDIKSFSAIYKLRKGRKPRNIKEAKSIFLTTNSSLAYAGKKFEISETSLGAFIIPACLTDVFVGTVLWLQSPAKVIALNEKKIIADCYAALQPSDQLIKKFIKEIERLKTEGKINDEECYLLRTNRVVMDLLEKKTMGDPDSFTDKTSDEILEEIKLDAIKDKEETLNLEKKSHRKTLDELKIVKKDRNNLEQNVEKRVNQLSTVIGVVLYFLFLGILIAGYAIQLIPDILEKHKVIKTVVLVITILLTIPNVLIGFHISQLRDIIKDWIKRKLLNLFSV